MTGAGRLPYAVLAGMDDVRGMYAARTLAGLDVPLIGLLKSRNSAGRWTRLCERFEYANTDTDETIDALIRIGESLDDKAVLVPCFDTTVILAVRHRDKLAPYYHLSLPEADTAEMMLDKGRFYSHARSHGLPIPRTVMLDTAEDVNRAVEEIGFPCIIKPPASKHPEWQQATRAKAFLADSPDELAALFAQYRPASFGALIAQQWIPGSDACLYATHTYFSRDSEPLVTFTSKKVRQWPPDTGEVSAAVEIRNDTVRDLTLELFRSVEYTGIGYLEVKQHAETGDHYIIEPNLRLSGRAGIAEAGGVALLATMYADAAGLPLPANRDQQYGGARWVYLRKDLQSVAAHVRRGETTWREWIAFLRGRKRYALWSWRDPGPFFGDLVRGMSLLIKERKQRWRRQSRRAVAGKGR